MIFMVTGFDCGGEPVLSVIKFIMKILDIVLFLIPMFLIVLLIIDFGKAVIAGNEEKMEQGKKMALKRVIFCVLLLCIKPITRLTITIASNNDVKYLSCIDIALKDDLSKYKLDTSNGPGSDGSGSTSSSSSSSSRVASNKDTENEKDTKVVDYKLDKDFVVIAHHHGFKISKYKIKILNKNGKKLNNSKFNFKIDKPIATINEEGLVEAQFAGKAKITVSPKDNPSKKQKIDLRIVHGTYAKVRTKKSLKVRNLKTGEKETLPSGTEGVYNGSTYEFKIGAENYYHGDILKVGENYYNVTYTDVTPYKYYISDTYKPEVIEEFINSNEFESKTKYLFWTSFGTQENYVLKGKKGKWKLYRTFDINTGDVLGLNNNDCDDSKPSRHVGICDSISGIDIKKWHVGEKYGGTGYWPEFNMHYAIYKRTDNSNSNGNWWHECYSPPREPKSHGCVRHKTEDLQWVFKNFSKITGSQIIQF